MDLSRRAGVLASANISQFTRKAGRLMRMFGSGLRFRLLFLVIGIALVSLLSSILILFSFQRKQLIESARSSTTLVSNLVEANLQHAMQSDDWDMVNDLIQTAAGEHAVDALRIVSPQGVVLASSDSNELGSHLSPEGPVCQQCHAADSRSTSKIGAYDSSTGQQKLFNINLIQNGPDCWNCHVSDQQVLGVLMFEIPLTQMNNQLKTGVWRTTMIALIACVLLVSLLAPLLNRHIIHPVEALSKGVSEITSGNLDYVVTAANQDELGSLAESFDQMRQELKSSYMEIGRREKEALALYQLGTRISASLTLSELLDSVAEASVELLSADIGMIGLYDEASQEIVMKAAAGVRAEAHKGMRMLVCPHTPGSALLEGLPVFAEAYDQNNLLHTDNSLLADERIVSILAVPLHFGEKFLGAIEVMTRDRRQFTQQDAKLLVRLAHHVVVSIENAQLYQQLRHMATLEERDRLAREMHDHLAQLLGYVNVRAAMAEELLTDGRLAQAKESLAELKRTAKIAYTDVREEIFNLRTSVSARVGLLPTLRSYLVEYHTHYGLETRLLYEHEALTEFPSEVASQLLRIIQEALTNVRKHASASLAWVRFIQERGLVCIQVEDNGLGFSPEHPGSNGRQFYGLQIMRERAEIIGGSLSLDSEPGRGTRVTVRIPISFKN